LSDNLGITDSQLLEIKTQPNVVLIDLRKKEEYAKGHIKGSKILKLDEKKVLDVPKNSKLILISYDEEQSKIMANKLRNSNFDCYYLLGGIKNWNKGLYCTNISYVGTDYP